jgi:hypothetical protein
VSEAPRRRRRVRSAASNSDATVVDTTVVDTALVDTTVIGTTEGVDEAGVTAHTSALADEPAAWVAEPVEADTPPAERGLRGLVGGGSSQVSPTAALRARDAARPRPEDLARAEADLTIVRRNWSPRE